MDVSNRDFIHGDPPTPPNLLPLWLSKPMGTSSVMPPTPSVTLSLSPSMVPPPTEIPWLQPDRLMNNSSLLTSRYPSIGMEFPRENAYVSELLHCCNELEEKQRAWAAHKKESAWRLKRVELQLESEKACKKREKMEETEAKIKALREEQRIILERIEAEYKEQLSGLRKDAETKEQKLAEQWAAKHKRLMKFLQQLGVQPRVYELNG